MQAVLEAVETYRHDLEEAAQALRHRGQSLAEDAPKMIEDTKSQIEPHTQELVNTVQDTSQVSPAEKPIVKVFGWSTVMVFFANLSIILGIYFVGPVLSLIFGKFGAFCLAAVVIPSYGHYAVKRAESGDDSMIRMQLLSYAIIQGMLMGYVIDSIYLSYIPYAVITPAIVTVSFATVAKQSNGERKMLLGGTIGTAISVNFILGMITGSLSFVYFLLTLTYAGIAAVIMQLCLRNLKGTEDDSEHFYQNALSCSYVIAKVMFYLMFGSYHSDVQAQKQD
ncbi:hypothetical protein V3C99_012852 [Haemonchus contortus]|uniref:MFS transporter n=1 Tax=Haemonchus contortus TaxID=6289 RepID=A0A7I4Y401_HAECO